VVAAALALPLPAVVAVVALAVGAGGWWLWQRPAADPGVLVPATAPSTGPPTVSTGTPPPTLAAGAGPGPAGPPGSSPSGAASATVHVAGAVGTPGIVVVAPGARVVDAVAAAGGLAAEADVTAVNLARPVTDGEMILVPVPGQQVPAAAGGGPGPGAVADGGSGASGLVDVNRATAGELEQLPGIGPVLAERIVAWREDTGPFASVDDLAAVPGIGPATLEELRDSATV
jgi:competence protein ComEA